VIHRELPPGNRQYVISLNRRAANAPTLLWAGDLDRDGRLDLFLDVETKEAHGSTYQLWLSTFAKNGDLVGLAATLHDPAC
jgi:hypothetical protein